MPNNIVIIGGGESVFEGSIEIGLQGLLKDNFVISCNTAFHDFESTGVCILDEILISNFKDKLNKQENVITSKGSNSNRHLEKYYEIESYKSHLGLTGIYALSLMNKLFRHANIFLIGFDFCNGNYHTRNEKLRQLEITKNDVKMKVNPSSNRNVYDLSELEIKQIFDEIPIANNIYNVNVHSKIPNYVKLTWNQFFAFVNTHHKSQQYHRSHLKILLQKAGYSQKP